MAVPVFSIFRVLKCTVTREYILEDVSLDSVYASSLFCQP